MIETTCPSRQQLCDYLVGKLPDELSQGTTEHVEGCSSCQAIMATLDDADDTFVARLRGPAAPDPILEESQCGAAVARARAMAARSQPDEPAGGLPAELGDYLLLERLGRGAAGTVYKARHTKLDRLVAVKVVPKSRLADDRAVARFQREMKAVGRLNHPNIVQAHDAREIDGTPALIMEYVEGTDLAELIRRLGRVPVEEACELVRQTALGLQYAHEHGLIHRDVKPSNVMVTPQGEVKVLDLGLARFRVPQATEEEMTGSGQAMGTADYIAPEQVSDSRTVGARADVYSLGCTLYKLLAGRAPFGGPDYPGAYEKMTAHLEKPVPPVCQLVPDVPAPLAAVVDRMLAKDPNDRFATPAAVVEDLGSLCAGADLQGLFARAEAAVVAEPPAEGGPAADSAERLRRSQAQPLAEGKRGVRISVVVGLMLLSFLGGLACGIVITIKKGDKTAEIEAPWGSRTRVDEKGNAELTLREDRGDDETPPPDAAAELKKLQGAWEVVSVEAGEASDLAVAMGAQALDLSRARHIHIQDHLVFYDLHRGATAYFAYLVDPTSRTKTIDLSSLQGVLFAQGIYEIRDDQLRICLTKKLSAVIASQRPNDFTVEPGSGDVLFVFRRRQPSHDEKAIDGWWNVVSATHHGRQLPKEELAGKTAVF
ncbi:MAG: protein kinase domain-containing protein, partial [Planctomycetota bacterium]